MEQAVYGTACGLAEMGHEVTLFTAEPLPGWEERAAGAGKWPPPFQVRFFPYRLIPIGRRNSIPDRLANYPLFALRLGRALAKAEPKPDVVYCQGLSGFGYALGLAGKSGSGPLVVNPQGMEELKVREWAKRAAYAPFNRLLKFTARRAARVIATDTPQIAEVQKLLGVPADRVALIPNAVDLSRLDKLADTANVLKTRQRYKPNGEFLIVSVGRLEANKGLKFGLEALARAEIERPWRWVIVGKGSQEVVLKREAARLGLLDKSVVFAGSLPDQELHALYEAADLFLHPTLYEGSSLVTLEAMSHHLPVVASAAGGLPDKIVTSGPEANGRLCPPGDAVALARAISEIAGLSEEQRAKMGVSSRAKVEQFYTWPQVADRLSALFEEICKES
jgi:glycosyltransferase involved in cell wall biosynthesis